MRILIAVMTIGLSITASFAGDRSWDGLWDGRTNNGSQTRLRVRFENGEMKSYRFGKQQLSTGFSSISAQQAMFGVGKSRITLTRIGPTTASFVWERPPDGRATATLIRTKD